jgi:hypothetical protein
MYIVVRDPLYRAIAIVAGLALTAIIYFAVIKPNNDSANQQVKQGEQQLQQAVNNANKQTNGAVPAGVTRLVSCIAAAGTNTAQLEACKAKFK